MSYDEDKVKALIEAVEDFDFSFGQERGSQMLAGMKSLVAALKPKPAKFYVMPEWDEFCKDKYMSAGGLARHDGSYFTKEDYNIYREATATDKPMVHIPAGDLWPDNDIQVLRRCYLDNGVLMRPVIDAIKTKLESKP